MATALFRRDKTSDAGETLRHNGHRRWKWIVLTAVAGALGLLWMAPVIVAKTSLRQWAVAMLIEDLDGSASAGSMSLGWFSPAVLEDVEVQDADGQTVLTATKITGNRSLWALATDRSELGTLRVEGAKLHLALRTDGSNLEDVLRPLLESEGESTDAIHVRVEVVDATIAIEQANDEGRWQVERLNLQVDLSGAGGQAVSVTANGVVPDRLSTGRFVLSLQMTPATGATGDEPSSVVDGAVKLKTEALPVEMFQPLLLRFAPHSEIAGRLSSNIEVRWSMASSPSIQIKGRVDVDDLRLSAAWFGDDVIRMRRLEIPCDVDYRDGGIDLRQLSVACDVGRLALRGSTQLDRLDTAGIVDLLLAETYQLDGQIDLARLAEILPRTLRIKEGTKITGGHVRFGLSRQAEGEHVRYRGSLRAENLSADSPDGPVLWRQPIEVMLSVRESADQSVIEQLQCRSDFLVIQASGRLDDLTASADFDLQRLVEQISQVVDLGELQLAGRGRGQFHIRRSAEADFTASGRIGLTRFRLSGPQQRSWTEERVTVTLDAAGEIVDGRPTRLRSATATAIIGDERLVARLTTPVADIREQANWPVQLQMTTRLAPWLPRLDPWLSLPALSAEGDCRFNALVDFSSSGVLVRESHLEIDRLRATAESLWIVEPHVDLQLAGQWEFASGNLKVQSADLKSGVLSVASKDFTIGHDEAGRLQLAGGIQFQADAARLQKWFSDGRKTPAGYELAGQLSGQLQLAGSDGPTSADLEIVAEDMSFVRRTQPVASAAPLVVRPAGNTPPRALAVPNVNLLHEPPRDAQARSSQTLWHETKAVLKITSRYDPDSDVLEIKSVDLDGSALYLQGAGRIAAVATRRQLKLRGQLDYDLSKFSPLLQAYAGSGIKIAGRNTGTFSLAGPLAALEASDPAGSSSGSPARPWIELLTADVQLGWREIDFYGLKAEHGTLQVKLSGGQITVAPLDLKVNRGRVTAAPTVRLTGEHAVLLLGKGSLARDVVLTKEVCAGGLKYIAPVVADAVDARGRFSIDLDGATVPLSAPGETKLSGRLTVHTIKLTPGPLTDQFLQLAGRLETIFRGGGLAGRVADTTVTMRENQQVEFRMAHGRIYHQGLELVAAGAVIRTSGSVGTDETLDLIVELPIQEKWIGRDSRLAPWRNRVIRIPIRGTLSRPKVDARVLGDLAARLARQAGQKFLQDQFNKGFEKLLQPRGAKP